MVINPIVGVFVPIIRIPIKRWGDHPQYSDFWPWHKWINTPDIYQGKSLENQLKYVGWLCLWLVFLDIDWDAPPNSHHQDHYVFNTGSQAKHESPLSSLEGKLASQDIDSIRMKVTQGELMANWIKFTWRIRHLTAFLKGYLYIYISYLYIYESCVYI